MTVKSTYDEQGFYGPVRFLATHKIKEYQTEVYRLMREGLMQSDYRCKSQVIFPFVAELAKQPVVVDYVKQILGPNFHCWDALFWVKDPESEQFVSWHQDATYWNFAPKENAVTIWVTLSGATKEMGCIQFIPGSHKQGQQLHSDITRDGNMLMRGQTIEGTLPTETHYAECNPGTFMMFHPHVVHGSGPNTTETPRVAIGFVFAATDVKPIAEFAEESTLMVSGVDSYNYMRHDPAPTGDFEKDHVVWQDAYDRQHENYYKMRQKL